MGEKRDPAKQREYVRRHSEKLDDIKVRPPKGTKERWRAEAEARGKSLQRFVIDAVGAEIKNSK